MKFFTFTCFFLLLLCSCSTVPLDSPSSEEEFPLKGPKRAILVEMSFPAQNEGFASSNTIKQKIDQLSEEIKLSQEQLDTVRLFKGGELNHLLENIQDKSPTINIIKTLRDMGVILNIHPQQILNTALPQDPEDFQFSEASTEEFVKYLFNRAMVLLQKKRPDIYSLVKNHREAILKGIAHEISSKQTFPYNYSKPRLSHVINLDSTLNMSYGYTNIKPANELDGIHHYPPSLYLKALGLLYGMTTVRVEENFFSAEIKKEESYKEGILELFNLGKKEEAFFLAGRLIALVSMSSIPAQLDPKYTKENDSYRDQLLVIISSGFANNIFVPESFHLQAGIFSSSAWQEGDYEKEALNYYENELDSAGNLTQLFSKIAKRANSYPSTGKMTFPNTDLPYYPHDAPYKTWNYYNTNSLFVVEGNLGENDDRVIIEGNDGKTYTVSVSLIEMAVHLQPLATAGIMKVMEMVVD